MVAHLVDGLQEDLPKLSSREALHELLAIMFLISETLPPPGPERRWLSQGAPPMT